MASSRVFAMSELVEMILLKMSPWDIMAVARTSRTIHDTVECLSVQSKMSFVHTETLTQEILDELVCQPCPFDYSLRSLTWLDWVAKYCPLLSLTFSFERYKFAKLSEEELVYFPLGSGFEFMGFSIPTTAGPLNLQFSMQWSESWNQHDVKGNNTSGASHHRRCRHFNQRMPVQA